MAVRAWPRLLWLVSFPLEACAGWLLLDPVLWRVLVALLLHVVASGVFGLSLGDSVGEIVSSAEDRGGLAWPLLGWTLSLILFPLLGMLVVALAFVLMGVAERRSGKVAARLESAVEPEEEAEDPIARARAVEVSLLEEREIEPVVDVLQESDPELKRAAIETLTKGGATAEAVRLLRGILHDPLPEARLYASLSLSKLEDEIGQEILGAQATLQADPMAVGARERLAQLYLDYTLSGFLEGVARDYYLELAREAFEEVIKVSPNPDELTVRLARVHLMLGNIAEAAALLDEQARENPGDPEARLLRMEVIYQFGDFRELSIYARRALSTVPKDTEARELVGWWAGEEEADGVR